jgi:hypothetical protein
MNTTNDVKDLRDFWGDDIIARRKELKPLHYETVPVFSPELVEA